MRSAWDPSPVLYPFGVSATFWNMNLWADVGAYVAIDFTYNELSANMAIEKIKILRDVLELPAKQYYEFGQFGQILR